LTAAVPGDRAAGGEASEAPDSPDLSVVVCTRDRPALLARALASVRRALALAPEMTSEIIVVDDGEEPLAGLTSRDERIRVVPGPRRGAGAARAAGLAAAHGALVAYCDDDDEWSPDHLRVLLDALQAHPEAALVYGNAVWRDAGLPTDQPSATGGPPARAPQVGEANRIHVSDVLHRASAARDVGGFDPSLRAYEDLDLWLRMDEAHVLRLIPATVTIHERRPDSVTAADHPDARERLLRYLQEGDPELEAALARRPGHPMQQAFALLASPEG